MVPIVLDILILLAGFFLLAKGADGLVDGGATIARKFGVPPMLVGLTIVALLLGAPSAVVASTSPADGNPPNIHAAAAQGDVEGIRSAFFSDALSCESDELWLHQHVVRFHFDLLVDSSVCQQLVL